MRWVAKMKFSYQYQLPTETYPFYEPLNRRRFQRCPSKRNLLDYFKNRLLLPGLRRISVSSGEGSEGDRISKRIRIWNNRPNKQGPRRGSSKENVFVFWYVWIVQRIDSMGEAIEEPRRIRLPAAWTIQTNESMDESFECQFPQFITMLLFRFQQRATARVFANRSQVEVNNFLVALNGDIIFGWSIHNGQGPTGLK